jgi:hypothetical protein
MGTLIMSVALTIACNKPVIVNGPCPVVNAATPKIVKMIHPDKVKI